MPVMSMSTLSEAIRGKFDGPQATAVTGKYSGPPEVAPDKGPHEGYAKIDGKWVFVGVPAVPLGTRVRTTDAVSTYHK